MGSTITSTEAKSNTYRVLVDLDGSTPPIWRRLDLRADLPLDVVHLVVQAAFDWENRHLYRFAMGGGPFDDRSLKVLCDEDIAEGEDGGLPASQTSLGAMMSEPGDRLSYVYDYGDFWELTLELEQVFTPMDDYPAAVVIDGEQPHRRRTAVGSPMPCSSPRCYLIRNCSNSRGSTRHCTVPSSPQCWAGWIRGSSPC